MLTVLKKKENIFIFGLFLLFFPLKTQLQNLLMFVFDYLFRNGITSEIFTYNYSGTFKGCEKMSKITQANLYFNWFQKHGIYFLQFLPSFIAFWVLFKRYKKGVFFQLLDWFLVIITCFSILTAIIDFQKVIFNYHFNSLESNVRLLFPAILFLTIGFFIFFRLFTFKEKLQTIVYGILGFYASFFLWMQFLGPKILPVIQ